jgi:hypothetical protein
MNFFGLGTEAAVHTRGKRTDSACKAALVLGSRADVLRRRPAARRRRTRHKRFPSPPALLRSACKAALVLGSHADVLRRRPAARSPPAASPPRPVHHVDSCCCSRCLLAAAPCPPPCHTLPRTVLTTPRPSHPQPSARNRPGERMSLLDEDTYKQPDAEVLPLITPAAARARDAVRRISQAPYPSHPLHPPHRSPTSSHCCCVSRTERVHAPSLRRSFQFIGGGGAGAHRGVPGGRHGEEHCTPPLPPCCVDERP